MGTLKKTALGLLILVGVANAGALIGNSFRQPLKPNISYPPLNEYSSYEITMYPDGSYSMTYKGHDPTVVDSDTYVDSSNGFFGIGGRSTTSRSHSYIPGKKHQLVDENGKKSVRTEECIKAEGGGESNGALVGASVASGFVPAVAGIPYVGWLASGWLVMFGQDVGSSVGGEIASTIKGC